MPDEHPASSKRIWLIALCFPLGILVGGFAGGWFGNVRIGLALGAAFGMSGVIILLAALAVRAAMKS